MTDPLPSVSAPVLLYVYDLSGGLARTLSPQLVGRTVEGIWHTSVVVFGTEYYYGQGIQRALPGTTQHGAPVQQLTMGTTQIPLQWFEEFVASLAEATYTAERYHLLDNNCNNFTNDAIQFLTGQEIPLHIRDLPRDVLSTPLGQALLPMLEGMFGPSQLAGLATPPASGTPSVPLASAAPQLCEVTTAQELADLTQRYRGVVVFFTSATCPPCRAIEPEFQRLLGLKTATTAPEPARVVGARVDMAAGGAALAAMYQVTATPTFVFLLDGWPQSRVQGAQIAALQSDLDLLEYSTYPRAHPHTTRVKMPVLDQLGLQPILFPQRDHLVKAMGRCQPAMSTLAPELALAWQALQTAVTNSQAPPVSLFQPDGVTARLLETVYDQLPISDRFALVDLLRYLVSIPSNWAWAETSPTATLIQRLLSSVAATGSVAPKPLLLTTLRLACNLFAGARLVPCPGSVSNELVTPGWDTATTQLLVRALLHTEPSVRQQAASLAFNVGIWVAVNRNAAQAKARGQPSLSTPFTPVAWDDMAHEDWLVECVSAIVQALDNEHHEQTAFRLVAALGRLMYLAPPSQFELVDVLDVVDVLATKHSRFQTETRGPTLVREVEQLINTREAI
ncbi:hypothetical protein H4R34_000304 [Dimargaris verticillata]|uniref:PPPDE peptidase domain-containing protein n=1 Tax=Dimargaris verticillata TaxID=2761393 RepID=A0A9W8EG11_9FUNG|nr:hypothetical protein H4R34_000304 [Dimargaris verticillata]